MESLIRWTYCHACDRQITAWVTWSTSTMPGVLYFCDNDCLLDWIGERLQTALAMQEAPHG